MKINSIIDGISIKLNEAFGDEYEIYTEQVKQGLSEPCFQIQLVTPKSIQLVNNRYLLENLFCINYFPKSKEEPRFECLDILDKLFDELEYITVEGSLIRGIKMRGEFVEGSITRGMKTRGENVGGMLIFHINYNITARKVKKIETMDKLDNHSFRLKGIYINGK